MSAVESWFTPVAAVAEPLPGARPKRRPAAPAKTKARPKGQQRLQRNFRVRGSLVFMVVFAVMLIGVVAVNVAVLRAHVSVNDLDQKIAHLQQENATAASQLSSDTAAPRVQAAAAKAHFVPAPSADTTLVDMGSGK